jgi:hypothetical protein
VAATIGLAGALAYGAFFIRVLARLKE